MEATNKPAPRNTSRTVVVAVLALLIVVAAAGIVLAGRQAARAPEVPAAAAPASSSTSDLPVPPTAASSIRFLAASEKLPPESSGELANVADAMRATGQQVGLTARFPAGGDRDAAMALGRKRVDAIQHALQSNGISSSRIQAELIEVPAGALAPGAADRVEVVLR